MLVTSYTSSESSSEEEEEEKSTDDVVTLKRKREDDGSLKKMRKKKDLPLPSCFQTKGERTLFLFACISNPPNLSLSLSKDRPIC